MKAITVREPWASLIAAGIKTVENRASGTTHRGLLLIHTSQHPADPAVMNNLRIVHALDTAGLLEEPANPGAVIAVADLVDVHLAQDVPTLDGSDGTCCQPWGQRWHGKHTARHLVLANVRRLPEPFETRGALGIWTPPEHVTYLVNQQLATAGAR